VKDSLLSEPIARLLDNVLFRLAADPLQVLAALIAV
jgi:hypothetical protein